MPLEQDVLDIGRQLEKLVSEGKSDNETANDLLRRLKELPITLDILQKTRIGMAVNVVRKASTKEEVQSAAKGLIKSWKKLLDNNDKTKTQRQSSQDKSSDSPSISRSSSTASLPRSDSSSSFQNGKNNSSNAMKSFPQSKGSTDPTRSRCIDMLISSLKSEDNPDFDPYEKACAIEDAVFKLFKDTGTKYKNRIKSRVLNLRDKRNAQLRQLVVDGAITVDKFANMTPEEMACEDLKKERSEITKQAIKDHQLAVNTGTSTGQFKCGKCGKRNTTYNQMQTRSADEPMTTFVYCNDCGNRWKFC